MRPSRLLAVALLVSSIASAEVRPRQLFGTRAEAATLIVQGIESGSLPFAALAASGPVAAVGDGAMPGFRVPVSFEVPAVGLPAAVETAPTLEFYAYAIAADDSVADHLGLAVDRAAVDPGGSTGIRLVATLDLPPGEYSLRFLILEPESHLFGLRTLSLELPAPGESAALARPTIADTCPDWHLAITDSAPRETAAAVPVLLTGSSVALSSSVLGESLAGSALSATVRLTPVRAESTETRHFDARPVDGAVAGERLDLVFELPAIGRGVYRLSVRIEHVGVRLESPTIEVWIVEMADLATSVDPCGRTWSAILARSGGESVARPGSFPAVADATVDRPEAKRRKARIRRAYDGVLRQLAVTSDLVEASRSLCDVERDLASLRAGLQTLLRTELEVARRLAAREPEVLPSLMMLHHESYLEHRRRQQWPLASHSSRVVQALAELMIDRDLPDESLALASRILTSLAEHGHRTRLLVPSQHLLQEALEIDPDNVDALFLLAVSYEWLGRYQDAAELLERLLGLTAIHSEARLRLAILRRRTGASAEAEREFNRVLSEGAPPWLLSLSYQGLAGVLWEQERFAEAVELLRRGRLRLTADQRLYLLSAHALDRTGRSADARRLLSSMPVDGSLRTPRFLYGESLTSALLSLRESVERGVVVRLPLLAGAIEDGPTR